MVRRSSFSKKLFSFTPAFVSIPSIEVLPRRFMKSTKQIATLGVHLFMYYFISSNNFYIKGPAGNTIEMIEKLFLSGAHDFRLNFSHGEHSEKANIVKLIRQVEKKYSHPIAILGDLQVNNLLR